MEIFHDRRIAPRVHPSHSMEGEPHYLDPQTVAWVEKEPASGFRGAKSPRWRVQHLRGNDQGGSMQTSTLPMARKKAAFSALELIKAGHKPNAIDRHGNVIDVDLRR
jgi:hypothetical protein